MKRKLKLAVAAAFVMCLLAMPSCIPECLICEVRCSMEPDPGICLAYFPKYYFNTETRQCEQFVWGGCGGVVPFETLAECEACSCH